MTGVIARMQTGWWRLKEEAGQTTSEYLVIAGVIVAIVLAVAAIFNEQITAAVETLMGNVVDGAGGS
jgi:Flp pilus assembly pilin Flp